MHVLVNGILRQDQRAVARAMSIIENDHPEKQGLLKALYPYVGRAHIVGFTGAPGAGKSTLVNQVIRVLRASGRRVGVLAVDPSSPFTGGALLGDRVRMTEHSHDPGVYIRSMGSRGSLGGLAKASREMLYPLEAFGCDMILLETVGVGQSELDVMSVADTVALVLNPGAGDSVQTAKAGIMEIADVFIVNKAEIPGADALVRELQLMLRERLALRENWTPPILRTIAVDQQGVEDVLAALSKHREHLLQFGYWESRRQRRHREDALGLVKAAFSKYVQARSGTDPKWRKWLLEELSDDPYETAEKILSEIPWITE